MCKFFRRMLSLLSKPFFWSWSTCINNQNAHFVDLSPLPLDVILEIIHWLDVPDIHNLRLVNRHFNEITRMPIVWKRVLRDMRHTHVLPSVPPNITMSSLTATQAEAMVIRSINLDSNLRLHNPIPHIQALESPFDVLDVAFLPGGSHMVTLSKGEDQTVALLLFDLSLPTIGRRQHVAMSVLPSAPTKMLAKYMRIKGIWGVTVSLCWAPKNNKTEYAVYNVALSTVQAFAETLESNAQAFSTHMWHNTYWITSFSRIHRHRTLWQIGDMSLGEVSGRPTLAIVRRPRTITMHDLDNASNDAHTLKLDAVLPGMQHSIMKIQLLHGLPQIFVIRLLHTDSRFQHVFEIYELPLPLRDPSRHPPSPSTVYNPTLINRHMIAISAPPNNTVTISNFSISESTYSHFPTEQLSSDTEGPDTRPPRSITISACTSVPPGMVQWLVPVVRRCPGVEGQNDVSEVKQKRSLKYLKSKLSLSSLFSVEKSRSSSSLSSPSPPNSPTRIRTWSKPSPPTSLLPITAPPPMPLGPPAPKSTPSPSYYYRFPPRMVNRFELPLGIYPWPKPRILAGNFRSLWFVQSAQPRVLEFFVYETPRGVSRKEENKDEMEVDGDTHWTHSRPRHLHLPNALSSGLSPSHVSVAFDESSGRMAICDGRAGVTSSSPPGTASSAADEGDDGASTSLRGNYDILYGTRTKRQTWLVDYGRRNPALGERWFGAEERQADSS